MCDASVPQGVGVRRRTPGELGRCPEGEVVEDEGNLEGVDRSHSSPNAVVVQVKSTARSPRLPRRALRLAQWPVSGRCDRCRPRSTRSAWCPARSPVKGKSLAGEVAEQGGGAPLYFFVAEVVDGLVQEAHDLHLVTVRPDHDRDRRRGPSRTAAQRFGWEHDASTTGAKVGTTRAAAMSGAWLTATAP